MQTFPATRITGKEFRGIWIAVEGDTTAVKTARRLARILQAQTIVLNKKKKIVYHIAGVFASNYLVTLLSVVEQLSTAAGIPPRDTWKIFAPIIRRTVENVAATSPRAAITGVIARKDHAVIRKHFTALSQHRLRHAAQLYASLGMETIRLLKRKR